MGRLALGDAPTATRTARTATQTETMTDHKANSATYASYCKALHSMCPGEFEEYLKEIGPIYDHIYNARFQKENPHIVDPIRHAALDDSAKRKATPLFSGVLAYFPDALLEVARLSKAGNDKHNPGEPLHWSKGKSNDHADCIARHLLDHGTVDEEDGFSHSAKVAWRALALLQTELENADPDQDRTHH